MVCSVLVVIAAVFVSTRVVPELRQWERGQGQEQNSSSKEPPPFVRLTTGPGCAPEEKKDEEPSLIERPTTVLLTMVQVADFQGLTVSLSQQTPPSLTEGPAGRVTPEAVSPAITAITAINHFIVEVLRYGNEWSAILEATEADPHSPMAHVLECDFWIAKVDIGKALASLDKAKELVTGGYANERERWYTEAFVGFLSGEFRIAHESFCKIVRNYPTDLFAMKRGQLLAFLVGDKEGLLAIIQYPAVITACHMRPYYWGMVGFALEQNGRLIEAEEAGRKGEEIEPSDPWSHHAIAHALYFQGQLAEGLQRLQSRSSTWETCMSFMYTHNWFHVTLFLLDLNRFEEALSVFDSKLWKHQIDSSASEGKKPDPPLDPDLNFLKQDQTDSQDQLNALGLLWKMELRLGIAAGTPGGYRSAELDQRWANVISKITIPTPHWDPLFDILLIHGLGRVGLTVQREMMIASMEKSALSMPSPRKEELLGAAVVAAKAYAAHDDGDSSLARLLLQPLVGSTVAEDTLAVVSGSSEQRLVLHEAYLDVLFSVASSSLSPLPSSAFSDSDSDSDSIPTPAKLKSPYAEAERLVSGMLAEREVPSSYALLALAYEGKLNVEAAEAAREMEASLLASY